MLFFEKVFDELGLANQNPFLTRLLSNSSEL